MNKEKWQAELKQLQLTEKQKSSILQHVRSPEKKKVSGMYRLAVPTFAVLCALFLFLVMGDESSVLVLNHGAVQDVAMDHREYIMETLIYFAVALSLFVFNCILAFWIVKKTIR
ncbi:hypothetical protein [Solibacillus sp. FSL K6-1523]|uniref:hypothetical protein n=1 Tax=Solibacillus sp. FSL K6-1523 TaxID=2921471 RepID=UPI0030FA5576